MEMKRGLRPFSQDQYIPQITLDVLFQTANATYILYTIRPFDGSEPTTSQSISISRSRLFLALGTQDSSPRIVSFSYHSHQVQRSRAMAWVTYGNGQCLWGVEHGLLPMRVLKAPISKTNTRLRSAWLTLAWGPVLNWIGLWQHEKEMSNQPRKAWMSAGYIY
jgi:hypothetical protein